MTKHYDLAAKEPVESQALVDLLTLDEFEAAACDGLGQMAYDYYRGGAGAEQTLKANRQAFLRYEIWPRVLVDVSARNLQSTILGCDLPFPILVAPTAYQRLAHEEGEIATAQGTGDAGTIMVVSTMATTRMEDVAAAAPGPKWFQLYAFKDRALTRSLVERAEAAGYRALVLTVDTPFLGPRLSDLRNGFCLPPHLQMANLLDALPQYATLPECTAAMAAHFRDRHDASLTWTFIDWLRGITRLPIVLKGILRSDDAVRAIEHGAQGIIVSNHGGRQLDGAPASIDALPDVVKAVADRCPVLLDGGVRYGTDVLKAIGLGAKAVLIGRPILWGLAAFGRRGVARVLQILRDDFSLALGLAGCTNLAEAGADLIRRAAR